MSAVSVKEDAEARDTAAARMLRDDKTETPEVAKQQYEDINRQANEVVHGWLRSLGPGGSFNLCFPASCIAQTNPQCVKMSNILTILCFSNQYISEVPPCLQPDAMLDTDEH
jgi:hypothetical protein